MQMMKNFLLQIIAQSIPNLQLGLVFLSTTCMYPTGNAADIEGEIPITSYHVPGFAVGHEFEERRTRICFGSAATADALWTLLPTGLHDSVIANLRAPAGNPRVPFTAVRLEMRWPRHGLPGETGQDLPA